MPLSRLILPGGRSLHTVQRQPSLTAVRPGEVAPDLPAWLDAQSRPCGPGAHRVADRLRDFRVYIHPNRLACRAPRARFSMAQMQWSIMAVLPQDRSSVEFGLAVAELIRARHPQHTAKRLAGDLSRSGAACTIRTAENVLSGHLSAKTLTRLVRAYGLQLLIDAGAQVTGTSLEDHLAAEVAAAERARQRTERQEEAARRLHAMAQRSRADLFKGAH